MTNSEFTANSAFEGSVTRTAMLKAVAIAGLSVALMLLAIAAMAA
jgi:hypothetical protein